MPTMPVAAGFEVTSGFGARWGATHWGVDFGLKGGSGGKPIYAVKDGTVTRVGPAAGFGQWITLDHAANVGGGTSVYGHIIPEVTVGQFVREGERIGHINPNSTTNGGVPPHLHYEFHRSVWAAPGPDRLDPMATVLKNAQWPGEGGKPVVKPQDRIIFGVDISNHQKNIDLHQIAREGFKFVIIKASQGSYYSDPFFQRNLREARNAGLLAAAYVYVEAAGTPRAHAERMHSVIGDTTVPIALDVEDGSGRDVQHVHAVKKEIEALGYRVILTYLPRWYWSNTMGSPHLGGLPDLWTSWYPDMQAAYASSIYEKCMAAGGAGWTGYGGLNVAMWQFTSTALVAGQKIDANAFRGGEKALQELFTGKTSVKQPEGVLGMTRKVPSRIVVEKEFDPEDALANVDMWVFYSNCLLEAICKNLGIDPEKVKEDAKQIEIEKYKANHAKEGK